MFLGVVSFHETMLRRALEQAHAAMAVGEVPVGAVAVEKGEVVAFAHNLVESRNDATAHAEQLLLAELRQRGDRYLDEVTIYVTLEPCPQCAGALLAHRVMSLVYGATDPKAGACGSVVNLLKPGLFPHTVWMRSGVLEKECSALLREFFAQRR